MNNGTLSTLPGTTDDAADPCIMVIFGASGDLTRRLLLPSLYNLACDQHLPDTLEIVGVLYRTAQERHAVTLAS